MLRWVAAESGFVLMPPLPRLVLSQLILETVVSPKKSKLSTIFFRAHAPFVCVLDNCCWYGCGKRVSHGDLDLRVVLGVLSAFMSPCGGG